MIRDDAVRLELFDGLVDDSFGGAPSDQRDLGVRRSGEAGRLEQRQDPVHLASSPLHDRLPLARVGELVADEHAVLVVLVGGDDVRVLGCARHRAR